MTNEIEEAFISFWGRYYGHEPQPSDPNDHEIIRAFKRAYKTGFEAGYLAGAAANAVVKSGKEIEEVEG